jgi:8-oxo-(d)GTP phosphatase
MPLFLVRHAQAGSRHDYGGDDDTMRPLSSRGRHQAADLAGVIESIAGTLPSTIRTSPFRRCVQTIAPYGAIVDEAVEIDGRLAEGPAGPAFTWVREVASTLGARAHVWCSHGDIIPAILEMLAVEDGLDLGPSPKVPKASIWVLDASDGARYDRATYVGPTS